MAYTTYVSTSDRRDACPEGANCPENCEYCYRGPLSPPRRIAERIFDPPAQSVQDSTQFRFLSEIRVQHRMMQQALEKLDEVATRDDIDQLRENELQRIQDELVTAREAHETMQTHLDDAKEALAALQELYEPLSAPRRYARYARVSTAFFGAMILLNVVSETPIMAPGLAWTGFVSSAAFVLIAVMLTRIQSDGD